MLCLVADDYREDQTEKVGQAVARRLRAAARSLRLTQGQVFMKCNEGLPKGHEVISEATVSSVMGGRVNNPGIGTVLILTRALGLTPDQVLGIMPMPATVQEPVEDDVAALEARLEQRLEEALEEQRHLLDAALGQIQGFFAQAGAADRAEALEIQREQSLHPRKTESDPPRRKGRKKE